MIDNSKAYIICSAIYINDGKEYVHQPKNIKTGYVITGRRHCNCYMTYSILVGKSVKSLKLVNRAVEGFLTSDNLFLDRKEALAFGLNIGQVDPEKRISTTFTSEELY